MKKATIFISTLDEPEQSAFLIEEKEHERFGQYFDGLNDMFETDFFKHDSFYVCYALSDNQTRLVDVYMTDDEGDLQMYLEHCMEVCPADRYIEIYEGNDIMQAVENFKDIAALNWTP